MTTTTVASRQLREVDPVFTAWQSSYDHHANWDTAYNWGNHASAGYLTSLSGALLATGATTGATAQAQAWTNGITFPDNAKATFGTGLDASIYYDATNLTINPKEVGSGIINVLGNIRNTHTAGSAYTDIETDTNGIFYIKPTGTSINMSGNIVNWTWDVPGAATTAQTATMNFNPIYSDPAGRTVVAKIDFLRPSTANGEYPGAITFSTRTHGSAIAERMRVDQSGNVGIGTAAPAFKLDVRGSTIVANTDFSIATATGSMVIIGQSAASGNTSSYLQAYDEGSYSTNDLLFQYIGGNVGIGTTTPTEKLHISAGNALLEDNYKALFGTGKDASIYYDGTNLVINPKEVGSGYFQVSGDVYTTGKIGVNNTTFAEWLRVTSTSYADSTMIERQASAGNALYTSFKIMCTKSSDMADGYGTGLSFNIKDDAGVENNLGIFGCQRAGADNTGDFAFYTSAAGSLAEKVRLTSAGKLGIGTSTPDSLVSINGDIAIVDGMTAPATKSGYAKIYVDSADGDLKIKFGDGTVKTIVTDS